MGRKAQGGFNLTPNLAGESLGDRMIAGCGALLCIGLTALFCVAAKGVSGANLWLVAPVGASAVLMCALPASPLAQPWSIIGGNTVSALVGVAVGGLVQDPALADGLAVALAIVGMTLARCLHPPGGAVALLGVAAASGAGFAFALNPVALDSTVLVALGWIFHRVSGHSYPHRVRPMAAPAGAGGDGFLPEDLSGALSDMKDVFDVAPADLDLLMHRVEARAAARTGRP